MAIYKTMTEADRAEYERLTQQAEQIQMMMEEIENRPVTYGYARVSSKGQARDGNSLEAQREALTNAGAQQIFEDVYTGTTTDRPALDKLLAILKSGDTVIVTKLDRVARSVQQGITLFDDLCERGIAVNILNMGVLDNSPTGTLLRNVMLAFAEFERDMIMQRTREGREIARQKEGYREGRPDKYTAAQLQHAVELLEDHSYTEVVKMTGISKSTLVRAKQKQTGTC